MHRVDVQGVDLTAPKTEMQRARDHRVQLQPNRVAANPRIRGAAFPPPDREATGFLRLQSRPALVKDRAKVTKLAASVGPGLRLA